MKKLLLILTLLVLFSSLASAELFQFDNVKSYDAVKQEVTITNTFGLGEDIAKIKLNTPLNYLVPRGYQKIAEFELSNYKDYTNALEELKFYNANNLKQELYRTYDYKIKSYETIIINDYKQECSKFIEKNGTKTDLCYEVLIGTHEEQKEIWTPLEKVDFLSGEIKTIGIFTDVKKGDFVEWIPKYYGKEIEEWASFTESMKLGLVSYYKLDEGAGNPIIDIRGTNNGTNHGTTNTSGKLNSALDFERSQADFIYLNSSVGVTDEKTLGAWINIESNIVDSYFILGKDSNSVRSWEFMINWATNGNRLCYVNGPVGGKCDDTINLSINTWYLVTITFKDSTDDLRLFINGVNVKNQTDATATDGTSSMIRIGAREYGGSEAYFDGVIDEVFIFNRTLTYLEIADLYNSGAGPQVVLNSPENYYNTSIPAVNFNISALDYNIGGGIANVSLYIDNTLETTNTSGKNNSYTFSKVLSSGLHNWSVIAYNLNNTYNQSETRYINLTIASPTITLNAPINYFNTTNISILFNASVTDNLKVQNVSLYINGVLNETNTSNYNGTYLFNKTLGEGIYNWSIFAYDNESNPSQSTTRYFIIDYSTINITINSPTNNSIFYTDLALVNLTNSSINWTTSDIFGNLDKCILTNLSTGTNITGTCNSLNRTFYIPFGTYTYRVYANDTIGNYGSNFSIIDLVYKFFQLSQSYNTLVTETSVQNIAINLTLGSGFSLTSASLIYNGTSYSPSIASSGSYRYLTRDISIPNVSASTNVSFYWVLNWANSTNSGSVNTSSVNQTILPITIDNCNVNTITILNYTIYDEDDRSFLTAAVWNTSAKVYARLSGDLSGSVYEFYANTISTNPVRLCINSSFLGGETYRLDAEIQYTADDYVTEYHYIENATLNTSISSKNVSLYLLLINRSQEFLITFKNTNLIPVEGALIEITRQYLDLGNFLSVEISKTDKDGKTIGHFVLNEEVYTLYVKKNGVLLATFENVRAFCSNIATGDCRINLNQGSTTSNPSSFTNYLDVIGTQDYNDTTKVYTFSFTTTDSTTKTLNLTLYKFTNNLSTMICTDQLTSSSGTLSCTIPPMYYNGSAVSKIYVNGVLYSSSIFELNINKSAKGLNPGRFILAFLLIITIPLLAFTSGPMTLIMFIVGLIIAGGLALIDYGGFVGPFSAFLWLVIAAIVLLAKASRRREQ